MIAFVDSDSVLERDAIRVIVQGFASGGSARSPVTPK